MNDLRKSDFRQLLGAVVMIYTIDFVMFYTIGFYTDEGGEWETIQDRDRLFVDTRNGKKT